MNVRIFYELTNEQVVMKDDDLCVDCNQIF